MKKFKFLNDKQIGKTYDYIYEEIELFPKHETTETLLYAENGKIPVFYEFSKVMEKARQICGEINKNKETVDEFYRCVFNEIQTKKTEDLISLWEGDDFGFSIGKRNIIMIDFDIFDAVSRENPGSEGIFQDKYNFRLQDVIKFLTKNKNYTFVGKEAEKQFQEAINIARYSCFPVLINSFTANMTNENLKLMKIDLVSSLEKIENSGKRNFKPSFIIEKWVKKVIEKNRQDFPDVLPKTFLPYLKEYIERTYFEKENKEIPIEWLQEAEKIFLHLSGERTFGGLKTNERFNDLKSGTLREGLECLENAFNKQRKNIIR